MCPGTGSGTVDVYDPGTIIFSGKNDEQRSKGLDLGMESPDMLGFLNHFSLKEFFHMQAAQLAHAFNFVILGVFKPNHAPQTALSLY